MGIVVFWGGDIVREVIMWEVNVRVFNVSLGGRRRGYRFGV